MELLEVKLINSLLVNLEYPDQKSLKLIERKDISTPIPEDGEGSQGDENVYAKVFQSVENPDVYVKVIYHTDSYGYGAFVRGIQFVTPTQKTITIFE